MLKEKLKENNVVVTMRVTPQLYKEMCKAVRDNPELYGDKSHFARVAIIRELRRLKEEVMQ